MKFGVIDLKIGTRFWKIVEMKYSFRADFIGNSGVAIVTCPGWPTRASHIGHVSRELAWTLRKVKLNYLNLQTAEH